jgi:hypothetical protein
MKKFLVMYMAPVAEMEKMMRESTPEQQRAGMEEWKKWMESKKESFADIGGPLGKNKRVSADGMSEVRNEMGGYSIVQAESHEEAAALFADGPHFDIPGAYVEVMEIARMPA